MFLSLGVGFVVGVVVGAGIALVAFLKRLDAKIDEVNAEFENIDAEYARLVECWEQLAEKERISRDLRAQLIELLEGKTE